MSNNSINTSTLQNSKPFKKSNLQKLCTPAVIYLIFSLVQIFIDIFKGLYNQGLVKLIIMIVFTILLNALCSRGLGIISWIIVMVPFMLMSLITTILLFVFGLDPETGQITYDNNNNNQSTQQIEKTIYIDPRQQEIYEDKSYDPNDYYSGVPAEINHYNNTVNTNKVGTDCASKNMKTCKLTGDDVCYPMDYNCNDIGSKQPPPQPTQISNTKNKNKKSIPSAYSETTSNETATPDSIKKDEKFYGSNIPNSPYSPVPKMMDGPITENAIKLTVPEYISKPKKTD